MREERTGIIFSGDYKEFPVWKISIAEFYHIVSIVDLIEEGVVELLAEVGLGILNLPDL